MTEIKTCYLYAKTNDKNHFAAFDLKNSSYVKNLIKATIMKNTKENQRYLQDLANSNKHIGLILQLRSDKQTKLFTTK